MFALSHVCLDTADGDLNDVIQINLVHQHGAHQAVQKVQRIGTEGMLYAIVAQPLVLERI